MKSKVFTFVLFVLFMGLNAQNVNFNLTGAGARAAGMGGAFIGVADDATAVVWNPAGLTQLYHPEFSIVTRFINDTYEWNFSGEKFDFSQDHFELNFVSGAAPLTFGNSKLVFAGAYQRQISLYNYEEDEDYERKGIGGVNSATLGVGMEILPFLSAGFATNIWMGSYESTEIIDGYSYNFEDNYEETYSGLNFVCGGMMNLSNLETPIPLRLGVNFRTPFNLEIEYEGTEIETGYYDYEYDGNYTLEMPTMLGFGASFKASELFTIAADYETRMYSKTNEFEFDLDQIRVGGEYLAVSDFAVIPLRAGWQTYPTLYADENGDQIIGMGWSAGTGLIFERFTLEFTFSRQGYEIDYGDHMGYNNFKNTISASGILYF